MAANKVFIVEDDAVIARAVAAHLTTWQMQVQCAGNFEKITEEVEDFQPDIIIMDIKLPYYNGFYWCHGNAVKRPKYDRFLIFCGR